VLGDRHLLETEEVQGLEQDRHPGHDGGGAIRVQAGDLPARGHRQRGELRELVLEGFA
jgi:hypothetical protein